MSLETMTKLGTYTVGAGTDSAVSFSNIPQSYTDLILKVSGHLTGTGFGETILKLTFNSSTSGYSWRSVLTDASATYSQKGDSVAYIEAGIIPASQLSVTTNVFGVVDMLISNYTSNNSKAVSIDYAEERSSADNYIGFVSGVWANTAPITSLTVTPSSSNFSQYSTFTLYGVKAMRTAIGNSIKANGGAIAFDGTYVTHTFNTTSTFTPTTNLLVDYLVVAGGGGGGATNSQVNGGGGAGGLRSTVTATGGGGSLESALTLTANTNYAVTIGAGGACGSSNGSDSMFSTITSTGGGLGGLTGGGYSGGSGGGASETGFGGSGTANQGYAGGNGVGASNYAGGGGGGAGAAGSNATQSVAGAGGNGIAISISGSLVTYAGGGGGGRISGSGGTGGAGGGGAGSNAGATAGTPNTGGGGGGGSNSTSRTANGGSGIVIIRYKG